MENSISFQAEILQHGGINAGYVNFPFSTQELFGKKGQVKVRVRVDGHVEFRSSLADMGGGCHRLGLTQEIRKQLGKSFGDRVSVELWEDTAERIVEVPADVQQLFDAHPAASALYRAMSYTHRKEYMRWICEAKKPETRERRKAKMIGLILSGKRGL